MAKSIWKFPLEVDDSQLVSMPVGATILAVQVQQGKPCLWALVDGKAAKGDRKFQTYGTGHILPDDPGIYVGTYQLEGGSLVFHVFEETD